MTGESKQSRTHKRQWRQWLQVATVFVLNRAFKPAEKRKKENIKQAGFECLLVLGHIQDVLVN